MKAVSAKPMKSVAKYDTKPNKGKIDNSKAKVAKPKQKTTKKEQGQKAEKVAKSEEQKVETAVEVVPELGVECGTCFGDDGKMVKMPCCGNYYHRKCLKEVGCTIMYEYEYEMPYSGAPKSAP